MTSAEVEWVLDQWASVVTDVANSYTDRNGNPVDVIRVDRDQSQAYDGDQTVDMSAPVTEREGDLKRGVYLGASYATRDPETRGPGYNQNVDVVISCRIEGMTHRKYGLVDGDGTNGVPFEYLVNAARDALWGAAKTASESGSLLDVGSSSGKYFTLDIANENRVSSNWRDFYRHDFDLLLIGEHDP